MVGVLAPLSVVTASAKKAIDPLHQFEITTLVPLSIGGLDISFTNASLWLVISSAFICIAGLLCTRKQSLVPSKAAFAFEYVHNFIAGLVSSQVGRDGRTYFPYIFCLFLFILSANLFGMVPYSFTSTSHLSVTFTLALFVFFSTILIGIRKHKWYFCKTFFPSGVPVYIAPILVPIEMVSFMSRPFSLAIRLCANMVAGHVMIKIFASFVGLLPQDSMWQLMGVLPILMNTALTGFEILICCLQAYVFTILTCIYLNDALHLH